jgi:Tfp pilus assembly protein PilF
MNGDYDQASALFEESLELNRNINDQGMVFAELQNLGWVEAHQRNIDRVERCFADSQRLESSNDPYSTAMKILSEACITYGRGDKSKSQTLLKRAQATFKEAKIVPSPDDQFEINWLREQLEKDSRSSS